MSSSVNTPLTPEIAGVEQGPALGGDEVDDQLGHLRRRRHLRGAGFVVVLREHHLRALEDRVGIAAPVCAPQRRIGHAIPRGLIENLAQFAVLGVTPAPPAESPSLPTSHVNVPPCSNSVPAATTNAIRISIDRCGVSFGSDCAAARVTAPRMPAHTSTVPSRQPNASALR